MRADPDIGFICMAVYRPNEELLRLQVSSIAGQSVQSWKCIIGIDGEDVYTDRLVRQLTSHDMRFEVITFAERVGFYRNFERILAQVPPAASWVALSDQDDEWHASKLAVLMPHLQTVPLVTGRARVRTHGGASGSASIARLTVRRAVKLNALIIDNQVTGSLSLFRGSLLQQAIPFPEPTDQAFHDHWLGICAAVSGGIGLADHVVQDYIQHAGNVIGEGDTARLKGRLGRLRTASGSDGPRARLTYIRVHRWGWRVKMARLAMARFPEHSAHDDSVLRLYAQDRLSAKLVWAALVDCIRGDVPALRTLALLVGSAGRSPLDARSLEK